MTQSPPLERCRAGSTATGATTGLDDARLLELNRTCDCWPIDTRRILEAFAPEVRGAIGEAQRHLFAQTGIFLQSADYRAMLDQIAAIESIVRLPAYRATCGLDTRGAEVQTDTRGVLMGYDFHLDANGPRLIEINTNAGGAFLVEKMYDAFGASPLPGSRRDATDVFGDMFQEEWLRAGRKGTPRTLAIVDEAPGDQYLYPDMLQAARMLRRRFEHVLVVDPKELVRRDPRRGVLWSGDHAIDLVYNRLTDFRLSRPENQILRRAHLEDRVVLSPAPAHHALFAHKRNLEFMSDPDRLREWGADPEAIDALTNVPHTVRVGPENADALWAGRRALFFKPTDGFGSRAVYRGAKLTRRVWHEIVSGTLGDYVAQTFVAPGLRRSGLAADAPPLKFDLRIYTYAGKALALVARIYQGQTTNFRTEGGGFAPVTVLGAVLDEVPSGAFEVR